MAAARKVSPLATFGSSRHEPIPRIYEDVGEDDTRIDPNALISGALGSGTVRTTGGTMLMAAAVVAETAVNVAPLRAPAAGQRHDLVPSYDSREAQALAAPKAPKGPDAAATRSVLALAQLTTIELVVGGLGITTFGVLVAALWVYFG